MNISSISGNSGFNQNAFYDKAIMMLEKQKERIHAQIQKINQSDMDKNTKQEYVKVLKNQIEMIDTQIQQKRTEKMTQAAKQTAEKQSESASKQEEDMGSAYKADLIKADFSSSKADVLNQTKDKLDGRGRVLSEEIALDSARGAAVGAKQAELQKIETSKWKLDGEVGEALGTAKTEAERGAKAAADVEKDNASEKSEKAGQTETDLQNGKTEAEVRAENADMDGMPAETDAANRSASEEDEKQESGYERKRKIDVLV